MKERALNLLASVGLVLYPLVIYFGIKNGNLRWASLGVLLIVTPALLLRMRRRSMSELTAFAWIPLLTISVLGVGGLLNRSGVVLATPVIVNAVLFFAFSASLWTKMPMIERFARLQEPDLSDAKIAWCRSWTIAWCAFFVVNAVTAGLLARFAPLQAWTLYNSLIAYMLIGLLFGIERVWRWFKFERISSHSE